MAVFVAVQIFDFLDVDGLGSIDLVAVIGSGPEWLDDLDDEVRACVCGLSAGRGAQRWTACTQDAGPRHGRQGGQEHEE